MYIAIHSTATAHNGVPYNNLFTINYAIHCILVYRECFLGQGSFYEVKAEEKEVLAREYGCKHHSMFWVTGGGVCTGATTSNEWILRAQFFFYLER